MLIFKILKKKIFQMDIVNKHEVHEKSYRKLAAEYGVSGKWLIFENFEISQKKVFEFFEIFM